MKRVLTKCLVYQSHRVGPGSEKMVPLPLQRLAFSPPFMHVGIYFTGPLSVHGTPFHINRISASLRVLLHPWSNSQMSIHTFLQTLNRIISRRGLCSTIYSDNAKTFKYADCETRKLYKSQLSDSNQPWNYIDQDELLARLVS